MMQPCMVAQMPNQTLEERAKEAYMANKVLQQSVGINNLNEIDIKLELLYESERFEEFLSLTRTRGAELVKCFDRCAIVIW